MVQSEEEKFREIEQRHIYQRNEMVHDSTGRTAGPSTAYRDGFDDITSIQTESFSKKMDTYNHFFS